jgi:hypothetical protein
VLYDVLANHRLTLLERRLDGRDMPRELASRPAEAEGVAHFIVGPTDGQILFVRAGSKWTVEPVSLAAPDGPPSWELHVDAVDFQNGVWSPDGRFWSGYGGDEDPIALVIDTREGKAFTVPLRGSQYVQGFDGAGPLLVLRDDETAFSGNPDAVRFDIADPVSGTVHPAEPVSFNAPPHSSFAVDVAPRAGLLVTEDRRQNGELLIGDLKTGQLTQIYRAERTFGWMGFFPGGDRVAAVHYLADELCGETQQRLIVAGVGGGVREIWSGTASPLDFTFAPEGDIVGFDAWGPTGSSIVVADSITGRWVDLPLPEGAYLGELLAIRGGQSLPDRAAPAAVIDPSPTAAAPADPVTGAPRLISASVENDPVSCTANVRVQALAPSDDGQLVVIDELPPVQLTGLDRNEAWVDLAARPGTSSIAVSIGDNDSSTTVIWTPRQKVGVGTSTVEAVAFPEDWPRHSGALIWRPDGEALGLRFLQRRTFLWFELGDTSTRRVKATEQGSEVVAWSTDGAAIVVQWLGCIDFCDVQRTWLSTVRLSDGNTRPVTAANPSDVTGNGTSRVSTRSSLRPEGDASGSRLVFSPGIGVDEFSKRWPAAIGRLDDASYAWSADGRTVYVAADSARGRELLRIDNPRPDAPLRPTSVGLLPAHAQLRDVDILGGWIEVEVQTIFGCEQGVVDTTTGISYLGPCASSVAIP